MTKNHKEKSHEQIYRVPSVEELGSFWAEEFDSYVLSHGPENSDSSGEGTNGKAVDGPTLDIAIGILDHYGIVAVRLDGDDVHIQFDHEVDPIEH
jgi:hypothetical protein